MEEAAFLRELGKYRVTRRRDFVDTSGLVRKAATAPTSAIAATVDSKSAQLVPQQPSLHVDFWAGLDALLKRHVPNSAQRELVARAFDEVRKYRGGWDSASMLSTRVIV